MVGGEAGVLSGGEIEQLFQVKTEILLRCRESK